MIGIIILISTLLFILLVLGIVLVFYFKSRSKATKNSNNSSGGGGGGGGKGGDGGGSKSEIEMFKDKLRAKWPKISFAGLNDYDFSTWKTGATEREYIEKVIWDYLMPHMKGVNLAFDFDNPDLDYSKVSEEERKERLVQFVKEGITRTNKLSWIDYIGEDRWRHEFKNHIGKDKLLLKFKDFKDEDLQSEDIDPILDIHVDEEIPLPILRPFNDYSYEEIAQALIAVQEETYNEVIVLSRAIFDLYKRQIISSIIANLKTFMSKDTQALHFFKSYILKLNVTSPISHINMRQIGHRVHYIWYRNSDSSKEDKDKQLRKAIKNTNRNSKEEHIVDYTRRVINKVDPNLLRNLKPKFESSRSRTVSDTSNVSDNY